MRGPHFDCGMDAFAILEFIEKFHLGYNLGTAVKKIAMVAKAGDDGDWETAAEELTRAVRYIEREKLHHLQRRHKESRHRAYLPEEAEDEE